MLSALNTTQFSPHKILKHLDRVNAWLDGKNPPPITVELDMTSRCNHKCLQCTSDYFSKRGKENLPINLAKNIITQLAKSEIRGLIFTGGGEPLCHPDIGETVVFAKSVGLEIGFITNGSLLNGELAKLLLKCCTWVRISLDAASPKTFKLIHGMGERTFYKVIENIKLIVDIKKEMNSKCSIGVGFLTDYSTKDEMFKMAKLCKALAVDYLQFRPMQIHKDGKIYYDKIDITNELKMCKKLSSNKYRVLISNHKYDMMKENNYGRDYKKCYGHQFATVISAFGKMYLCCHTRGWEKYCIGDLRINRFEEIWNSEIRKLVCENIDFRDCVPLCRDNSFNQILWIIRHSIEHVNFL